MKVSFFTSASGRNYVEDFLDDLSSADRATIVAVLEDIEKYGLSAVGCQFRQIEGKLWEIKIKAPTGEYRIFYVMVSSDEMMCLHAYRNKVKKLYRRSWILPEKGLKEFYHEKESTQ